MRVYHLKNFEILFVGDVTYPCSNGCGRVYKRKSTLIRHLRYECGIEDRLFSCNICQKRFSHKFLVRKHMVIVHRITNSS